MTPRKGTYRFQDKGGGAILWQKVDPTEMELLDAYTVHGSTGWLTYSEYAHDIIDEYEQALIDISRATDSRGLPIRLLHNVPPALEDYRQAVGNLTQALGPKTVFLQGLSQEGTHAAEQNYVKNLALLVRGWQLLLGREPL